jgi:hypothetical protein
MSEGPELRPLADALRALAPHGGVDRDDLLFRAGQASVPRPRRWPWLLASALSTSAALALGAVLLWRPPTVHTVERVVIVTVERQVRVPAEPAPPIAPPTADPPDVPPESATPAGPHAAHRHLQEQLLRWGLDGLGMPPPSQPLPGRPVSVESLNQPL